MRKALLFWYRTPLLSPLERRAPRHGIPVPPDGGMNTAAAAGTGDSHGSRRHGGGDYGAADGAAAPMPLTLPSVSPAGEKATHTA
ncbi:hypothetical protein GCM10028798_26930 [Humibacter antri]